jgi:DNA (cytosine-5)-methyltransferase 1
MVRATASKHARQAPVSSPSPTVLADNASWSDIAPAKSRRRRGIPEDRPPYRIPTMAEIAVLPKNGLTVATTFAGGGGSSTGYEMAGYRVLWASEFEPHAAATYAANHPSTVLSTKDIRDVDPAEVLEACGGPPDLFDGSPPCQDFSMAGKRSRGWGESRKHADGTEQRSDDLFAEYTRLVRALQPRAFVAENVAGLVAGVAKGQFKRIMAALTDCGYTVRARVLDAQWLGVPQRRRRVIIIGLRQDLGLDPPYPRPFPYRYSMLDACPWLGDAELQRRPHGWFDGGKDTIDGPSPTIMSFDDGASPGRVTMQKRPSSPTSPDVDYDVESEPAPTVTAKGGTADHWRIIGDVTVGSGSDTSEVSVRFAAGARKLTIAEVKRICSFPDDYVMGGSYAQQWARLGNSVPPLMMRAVAETVAPVLLGL